MSSVDGDGSCTIDMLRHGETVAGKCFLGSTDAELNSKGWKQVKSARVSTDYDLVMSSPLKRCRDFAEQYARQLNVDFLIEDSFREIHFGEWETQTPDMLWRSHQQELSSFWEDPLNYTPPGGEPLADFQKRVVERCYALPEEIKGKKVLLVCHAGVIKTILCTLLGIELKNMHKLSIDHGSVSQVSMWQQEPQVKFINHF